jgi:hypothetical protein
MYSDMMFACRAQLFCRMGHNLLPALLCQAYLTLLQGLS